MTQQKYLYCKRNRFYFRRRVPGLSTFLSPIFLALGTTDRNLAHTWLERLKLEFDQMFDSFVLLTPALPDKIVSRYFEHYLQKCVSDLNRQINFARMKGRFSADNERSLSVLPIIYESFLEQGIRKRFPVEKIDPEWDEETLKATLHLYEIESRKALSAATGDQLCSIYASLTSDVIKDEEHLAQLRAAHFRARLQALQDFRQGSRAPFKEETSAPPTPANKFMTNSESCVTAGNLSQANAIPTTPVSAPLEKPVPHRMEEARESSHKTLTEPLTTLKKLEDYFSKVQDQAENASPDEWTDDIAHVFWRTAVDNNMSKAVKQQRGSDIRRFMFITGLSKVTEIRQAHLTFWADNLQKFPKNFLRSSKDLHRTVDEVYMNAKHMAPAELGLDSSTRRRHVKSMELLIARARAEGISLTDLNTKDLKPKKKSSRNKHKSRAVFRKEEARQLFSHTIWTGARSAGRRHEPGTKILKDGKFWIPLILGYTGARRAEIAGMLPSDVENIEGVPCFVIQANAYRGIKGEDPDCQEDDKRTRTVPIHSHLIELGFLDYVKSIAGKGHNLLFPDVVPVPRNGSKRSNTEDLAMSVEKFGERFDDTWRKAMQISLHGNPRKLCIHSLRHYVNHTLLHSNGVLDVTRTDIIGHIDNDEKEGTNTSTYRDETPLSVKRDAIERLPRLM
ncbi:hypothetical protein [Celeribacter ethanolicus]|uniref:hypothetical protein n=1 Tax=Celeribacter ethanolicus TaxID=1758178 RepID=UPI0012DE11BF|nr:hypothetical protein [Celeribacter ethanolicus]